MLKHFFAVSAIGVALLAAYGCSGFTDEEAKQRCSAERQGRGACFDEQSYSDCLSCFGDCGDDCVPSGACPTRYACPSDQNATGQGE